MRIDPKALYGAIVLGLAAAACGGGATGIQTTTGPVTTANATVTLGTQQTVAVLAPTSSMGNTLTYLAGSGTVTATVSTSVPPGVLPITQDPEASPSTAPVEYITLTGTAKMTGLPAIALTARSITMTSTTARPGIS